MKKKEKHDPKLVALASELAKHMKTETDISNLSQLLTKLTVETAPGAEMEEHLGYGRHERSDIDNHRGQENRGQCIHLFLSGTIKGYFISVFRTMHLRASGRLNQMKAGHDA